MSKHSKTTLVVLLDAFRWDYLDEEQTPFLWGLRSKSNYVEHLINTGGYCERSVFMTGASPDVTDNYFAMAYMPAGYKRPSWEPRFNVPRHVRDRLCMTEDRSPDFEFGSFTNWSNGKVIESFWDVMRNNRMTWAFEACYALGIRSYRGRTTHGTRPIQLADEFKNGHQLYYIQFSEVDQQLHYLGTGKDVRAGVLRNVDAKVKWLYDEAKKHFKTVDLIAFGDHGMADIEGKIDLPLEYPPYQEGWDYLYLKSSAMIQFWIFNEEVKKHIQNDILLQKYGSFVRSPSKRQGDLIWLANTGLLISPCHFHDKNDPIKAMHGWNPHDDSQTGMAIVYKDDNKTQHKWYSKTLNDICPTICDSVGIPYPKYNEGVSLYE